MGTTTTIRGLSSSTKYYFRIRPIATRGGTDSSVANVTTKRPFIQVSGLRVWFVVYGVVVGGGCHDGGRSWSISNAVVQESGEQTGSGARKTYKDTGQLSSLEHNEVNHHLNH
jgi:hypothetical protein